MKTNFKVNLLSLALVSLLVQGNALAAGWLSLVPFFGRPPQAVAEEVLTPDEAVAEEVLTPDEAAAEEARKNAEAEAVEIAKKLIDSDCTAEITEEEVQKLKVIVPLDTNIRRVLVDEINQILSKRLQVCFLYKRGIQEDLIHEELTKSFSLLDKNGLLRPGYWYTLCHQDRCNVVNGENKFKAFYDSLNNCYKYVVTTNEAYPTALQEIVDIKAKLGAETDSLGRRIGSLEDYKKTLDTARTTEKKAMDDKFQAVEGSRADQQTALDAQVKALQESEVSQKELSASNQRLVAQVNKLTIFNAILGVTFGCVVLKKQLGKLNKRLPKPLQKVTNKVCELGDKLGF